MRMIVGSILGILLGVWLFGERGQLMRRSTWHALREGGWQRLRDFNFLHLYFYAHWPVTYINLVFKYVLPGAKPHMRQYFADHYHAKVLPVELAHALVSVEEDIPLQDLEQIIPYTAARHLVLQGHPDIVLLECPCRHRRATPCQPTQVCMIIGQPFAGFILEHCPEVSRQITVAEALEIIQAEHERGHIHTAYFKDAMLDRFYAICNCCKCCCAGIEAMINYGVPMIASSGYVAHVSMSECQACGTCCTACPFGAITLNTTATVSWEACMGCGVCEGQCPNHAIALARDERKGLPLDVRMLATPKES
jgi:Pyruvate/2-oxoacid:ferredoxin oxidoreductase delta subunit